MNKNILIVSIVAIVISILIILGLNKMEDKSAKNSSPVLPYIGQKIWTYNMNERSWHNYRTTDEDELKDNIVLQYQESSESGGNSAYHMVTTNIQVPKEEVWLGEASREFLINGNLYSYYPKNFEFHQLKFNGVKFVAQKMTKDDLATIFPDYQIILVSDFIKNKNKYSITQMGKKYIILNDKGEAFYKYYIIPNDSKNLQLGDFSNQFEIKNSIKIRIQRLEGCSKAYPCYDLEIK